MAFCTAIRRDSASLTDFPSCCHLQIFSYEISSFCLLKYPYSCFSSHFCFLIVVLLIIMLCVLFLVAVDLLCSLLILSSSPCIDASVLFSMLASPLLPSFLDTYSLSTSSLWCQAFTSSLVFFILCSICRSSSLVQIKNGSEYLMGGMLQEFIPLIIITIIILFKLFEVVSFQET